MAISLLLDLDRTLVDTHESTDWIGAHTRLVDEFGPLEGSMLMSNAGFRVVDALSHENDRQRWEAMSALVEGFELNGIPDSTLMPHALLFLSETRHLKRAVITSASQAAAEATLEWHDVTADVVVGRRGNLGMKPAPGQLIEALRLLKSRPREALMAGDSPWDEAAASAAGVTFVGVTNGRPDTGFAPDTVAVRDLAELLHLVLKR